MKHNIYEFILFLKIVCFVSKRFLDIQMFADWSCTLLLHNRTCCGKYRIFKLSIDLCISFISGPGLSDGGREGGLCVTSWCYG